MNQRTICKPVEAVGVGLHKGKPVRLRLEPLEEDAGIVFYRSDIALSVSLCPQSVIDTQMATVIGDRNQGYISTIEHFLSALYAYGIDNLRIIVDANEMPIMDGSAISFCLLLEEAGIQIQNKPKRLLRIRKPLEVSQGGKYVRLVPSKRASFAFTIDFDHPAIAKQSYDFLFSTRAYIDQIARARTFGFAKDIQYLQSKNLALGASLENAIGLDDHKVLNPEGLRFEDEFVRHKILDAMGDMMVGGMMIWGRYEAYAGSHALNNKLIATLMQNSDYYEVVSFETLGEEAFAQAFA